MSKRSVCVLPLFLVMGGLLVAAARASDQPKDSFGARLVTYDQAAGESYFALSVTPKAQPPKGAKIQDVVVLVDTSASQKNLFRDDSLTAVNELIRRLDPQDRVRLFAVDIEATPLHDGFSSADSQEVKDALAKLAQRTPLGATDMVAGLKAAVDSFGEPSGNPRVVIYVGDGVSFAKLVDRSDLRQLVDRLVTCQAAVSSYAIGPRRDISFLAVLANQSGGMVYIDSDDSASPQSAGAELAKVVEQTVYWPRDVQLPNCLVEVYPSTIPPLRADRETIVIGKLDRPEAARLVVTAEANGQVTELAWDFAAERSSEDFAFLPALVDLARDDGGLTLPTVGWAGLQEAARVLLSGAADLSVIEINKPVAAASDSQAMPENVVHFVAFQQEAAGDAAASNTDGDLQLELEAPTRIVEEAEAGRRVMTGKIQAEVEVGLSDARKQMGTNSEAAVQGLKAILDNVLRAPDLDPEIRAQLRDRIQTAIREASRRKAEQDEIRRQGQENMAIADEARRLAVELTDRRKQVQQLMEKYDALVDEGIELALSGRNEEAEENFADAMLHVADPIERLLPYHPIGESARFHADFLRQLTGQRKFRQLRHKNFANTLYEVERAAIPFPDEPPIIYPDAEKWERLSKEREKYKSMDLLGSGTKEKKIYDALMEETILEFDEAPLSEVVDYLKTARSIPIVIDKRALDDVGLGTDTPVTISLAGITLRSALKIMLKELDLTYVIRDEVLKITTPEEAENELITKVYPVGDLVIPVMNMGGGMGGGMGGMGGGMGGMGGGMGGMGGGMGGMGGGGFGGGGGGFGGMMDVEDDLQLGAKASEPAAGAAVDGQKPAAETHGAQAAADEEVAEPVTVTAEDGASLADAWDAFFAEHQQDVGAAAQLLDKRVRATARVLREGEKYPEIVEMIQAAVRNGQCQSWMYEALGLAMLAAGSPQPDVERAFLSAVDLSETPDDVMQVAAYMARVGLDRRALQLYRGIALSNPLQPEPYALALASAKRLDDVDGIKWSTLGILSQAWPADQSGIEDRALRLAKATAARLHESGQAEEAQKFEESIERVLQRDVKIRVSWTGDADIDLMVEEPGGTICSLQNARTSSGGVMLGDAYSSGTGSDGYVETYVCPLGFSGKYKLLIHKVWGDVTAGKVTVDIHTQNPERDHIHAQVELTDKAAVVLFDVLKGRRLEHLAQHQLPKTQRQEAVADRAMLSRQLSRYEDSLAHRDFVRSRSQQQRGWSGGRPVGFQPQITLLPQGTQLMPMTYAIASADRRYVRVSPSPMFSFIGEVNTFDFGGNPGGNLPDDDDDDN